MLRKMLSGLRFRLILIGILASVPALGLALYNGAQLHEQAAENAKDDVLRLANLAASNQDALIEGARQTLITLSRVPVVRDTQSGNCDAFLAELLTHYTSYSNFVVALPNGDVVCSGLPRTQPVNLADRAYFQRVLQTRDLAVSEYLIARGLGKAIITLACPVLDDARQLKGILVVGLDLEWMNQLAERAELPPGSSLTVIDRNGTILTRYPEHEKYVGKTFAEAPIVKTILDNKREGTTQTLGVDGIERLYAFHSLGNASDPVAYIYIGIPSALIFADADRVTNTILIGLIVVTVLALTAIWIGSDVFLLRRVNVLVNATQRLAAGDLSARTSVRGGVSELSQLAYAFDGMADSLQQRERERNQAEEELIISNKELVFQNEEKEKRAAELIIANKELVFQNTARKQAEECVKTQLQRLAALGAIDTAITGSVDLRLTLNVVAEQATTQLGVDAVAVLLLNPHTQTLTYAAGHGFRSKAIERSRLRLGKGYAGRAALERRVVSIHHFRDAQPDFVRADVQATEDFVCYHAAPLIAKGLVKGVLEVFLRSHRELDEEWIGFFETLAQQAAIALDSAQLFDNLQRSNVDLTLAYDATIEGWSRALDLRDKETEGHSLRVTELTERLARAMGVSEAEIVHIRRGALLHDIGKMGVPDHILLKPSTLTAEEWTFMRRHPQFAFDLLAPIPFLQPALDIPYCHHEKWDGTGYPRGLKGQQIPLAARLFAVVDVWDALRSDRPYRARWPEEKVLEHIRSLAGTHLDPKVVELFLRMVSEKTEEN